MILASRTKLWHWGLSELSLHSPSHWNLCYLMESGWEELESAWMWGLQQQEAVTCCPMGTEWVGNVLAGGECWLCGVQLSPLGQQCCRCLYGTEKAQLHLPLWLRSRPSATSWVRLLAPRLWATAGWASFILLLFVFNGKSLSCQDWHIVHTKNLGLMGQHLPSKLSKPLSHSSVLDAFMPVKL